MAAISIGNELVNDVEELELEDDANGAEQLTIADERSDGCSTHGPLPWIGDLRNPRVGPMVVLDDSGYLVPLCTAGDLLRGCRYFWRASQD